MRDVAMASNGLHSSVHLAVNGTGKMPIQPTPGAIRKAPNLKPKQRKSRTGCMTCKAKRLKCDEGKPSCQQCVKKGLVCEGYAKNFKWKSFDDIQEQKNKNAASKGMYVRRKNQLVKRTGEDDGDEIMELDTGSPSTKSPSDLMPPPRKPAYSSPLPNYSFSSPSWDNFGSPNGHSPTGYSPGGYANGVNTSTSPFSAHNHFLSPKSERSPGMSERSPAMSVDFLLNDDPDACNMPKPDSTKNESPFNPEVFFNPDLPLNPKLLSPSIPPVTRTPPPIQSIPPMWREIEYHLSDESDLDSDVEEIIRPTSTNTLIRGAKRRRLNDIDPDVNRVVGDYNELQMYHFYEYTTCPILSCKNASGENPWRDDLIARAATSPGAVALKHALFAMTSFHMKLYGIEPGRNADRGQFHTNLACQSLIKTMNQGMTFDENNIAALLVLSFSEVWDDPTRDGRSHVLGASKMFDRQLRRLHKKGKEATPFMRFLYNTWLYLDVLSSLSSGEDPYSLNFLTMPEESPAASPTGRRSSGAFTLQNEIDSLLGCAGDLFPLIARASKISNRLGEKVLDANDLEYITEGIAVRDELINWRPPDINILQASKDEHCSLNDIVRTAEVYRQTALLHLYRTFPPFGNDIPCLADAILDALLLIPSQSGSLCIHIWPLMASGCEMMDPIKRQLVRERFHCVREKLKVANVDSAIELLEEIWNRKDRGIQNVGWVSLAKERDWHLLLG